MATTLGHQRPATADRAADVRQAVGHVEYLDYTVPPNQLVPDLHPDLEAFALGEPVFATGYLVGLLEAPCMTYLRRHHLQPGQTLVGTAIDITHRAPAHPGDRLIAAARCTTATHTGTDHRDRGRSGGRRGGGTRFEFAVTARNHHNGVVIARGHITQHLVDVDTFRTRLPRP
ncbi:thioesterase family protein [Pseudonocardia sp. ICBG162]|uniref:thioesterase family protein n=1 Tax=Pseudonocardia sp. ICBG162 TaxID=2846761 RepID=UPI001CF6392D|nr:hotdog domain-containing protein [Pseudonocardia sp. ICBG162]